MTYEFCTLGCKVNQYESEAMAAELEKNGIFHVSEGEEADIYVINSCTVTSESDRKTRQAVRKYRKNHPQSIIVLAGCMVQASPETGEMLPEADIVIGNKNKDKLYGYILKYISTRTRIIAVESNLTSDKYSGSTVSSYNEKTRAIIKIEDGCNRFCSYCIIPYARGRVRSKPLDTLKNEALTLAGNGYREIVLVGINLSAYGTDTGTNIVEAVRAVSGIDGIERVRLGSLEPDHITDDVIKGLSEIDKFCHQFHISLQSGCDKILKKMNRHYNSVEYEDLCFKLRNTFPDCTLTTDIMVGFPGETESDFEISLNFMKKIAFEKVHVFPYSRRPGTPAAKNPDQIEKAEKQRRAEIMADEAEKIRSAFFSEQTGKTLEIIAESNHGGRIQGYTSNYIPVRATGNCSFGSTVKVKITGTEDDFCIGEITAD